MLSIVGNTLLRITHSLYNKQMNGKLFISILLMMHFGRMYDYEYFQLLLHILPLYIFVYIMMEPKRSEGTRSIDMQCLLKYLYSIIEKTN